MIRRINKDDINECVQVIKESFYTVANEFNITQENAPRYVAFATNSDRLSSQYESGRPMYGYFNNNNKLVGYYSLEIQENKECELNNLCVLPAYRHHCIGEELFQSAVSKAKELSCSTMNISIVEENTVLRKWYENMGANHIGTKKYNFFPFTCGYMKYKLGGTI